MLSDEGEGSKDARMQKVCFCDFCDEDGVMVRMPGCTKLVLVFIVNTIIVMRDGDYDNSDDGDAGDDGDDGDDGEEDHPGLPRRTKGTLGFS